MKEKYYLDTCIWLNLFKKEGDPKKGTPYWKIAQNFIEKTMFSDDKEIVYSGFVLKEIRFNLDEKTYKEKEQFFKKEKVRFVKATPEDYILAKKLEHHSKHTISFTDCMHTAICKRLNFILITRDKELIKFVKRTIIIKKPEDLFS